MAITTALGNAVKGGATSLFNDLTGNQLDLFFKGSEQSGFDFGQKSNYYLDGQPRLKFQYFVKLKFNPLATDVIGNKFVEQYLNPDEVAMLVPLTKSVSLPSMSIDTKRFNQYNHWRTSQSKLDFEPMTMSMHDVVDGKTLRFWEMYYEYYFRDNYLDISQLPPQTDSQYETDLDSGALSSSGSAYIDSAVWNAGETVDTGDDLPIDPKLSIINGQPEYSQPSVYASKFDTTHGFNLDTVQNQKHLIDYIEIYQYHAGRWSVVHLVKPVISKFNHDTLEYSNTSDTSQMTFTFEYEYALYHNYYSLFDEESKEHTGAGANFEYSNQLEIDHPSYTGDFNVRKRLSGDTPSIDESFGTLPNDSLLGNLVSDVSDILTTSPDKIGDSVVNAVKTGEWESPIDIKEIGNTLKGNLEGGAKNIGTKNLKSTVSNSVGAFTDFRRT